jgi:hypothetical protein
VSHLIESIVGDASMSIVLLSRKAALDVNRF